LLTPFPNDYFILQETFLRGVVELLIAPKPSVMIVLRINQDIAAAQSGGLAE
jgi:hypothetical protein